MIEQEPRPIPKTVRCKQTDEHVLRRLGNALIVQWDALPDALQDLIIDQAALVEDREQGPHAAADIENFIRNVKLMALTKAANP